MFIDYFFLDYCLRLYYDTVPAFKETIERESAFKEDVNMLWNSMNECYDPEKMNHIMETSRFYKLTYKKQWNETINGKETFYGHLISE